MGYLKYVRELWKKPKKNMPEATKARLMQFRREPVTVKVERPTRIDRARSLGYKAKQGFVVVRQRVSKSRRMRTGDFGGRRPKAQRRKMVVSKNYQQISEERVSKKFPNMEVLNSYPVVSDGKSHWFEVILVDPFHPRISKDSRLNWIALPKHTKRVMRGKTSAGRKSRGLRKKGKGAEKVRPSNRANKRLLK